MEKRKTVMQRRKRRGLEREEKKQAMFSDTRTTIGLIASENNGVAVNI